MKAYIDKSAIVAEIERIKKEECPTDTYEGRCKLLWFEQFLSFLDTLEVKEVDLIDRKTDWSPSKKQLESLKDLLHYNIGVFDYQKFMEVNSLYEDLIKLWN